MPKCHQCPGHPRERRAHSAATSCARRRRRVAAASEVGILQPWKNARQGIAQIGHGFSPRTGRPLQTLWSGEDFACPQCPQSGRSTFRASSGAHARTKEWMDGWPAQRRQRGQTGLNQNPIESWCMTLTAHRFAVWRRHRCYPMPSGIPRSKTRGLMAPRAKTAKIWPGHILKLQSVPNPKSPKI